MKQIDRIAQHGISPEGGRRHGVALGAGRRSRARAGAEAVISAYVRDISRRSARGIGDGQRSLARMSCAEAAETPTAAAEV